MAHVLEVGHDRSPANLRHPARGFHHGDLCEYARFKCTNQYHIRVLEKQEAAVNDSSSSSNSMDQVDFAHGLGISKNSRGPMHRDRQICTKMRTTRETAKDPR